MKVLENMSINSIFRGEASLVTLKIPFIGFLVGFINDLLVIFFDTIVVAVTLSNILGTLRQSRDFQAFYAKSLTRVLVEQGTQSHFNSM